jgi:hypothetical protein
MIQASKLKELPLNIHDKINMRKNAVFHLGWNQYKQLVKLNRMSLVPYYRHLMRLQAIEVSEIYQFMQSHRGKTRWQYENNC